ncbi:MAG: hypothetical protein DLM52_05620 [Chthoniobacterales bacterium]|nr:MAG: hypothetical protein DLM52_05620 [Chthoniobacterales bacterium]
MGSRRKDCAPPKTHKSPNQWEATGRIPKPRKPRKPTTDALTKRATVFRLVQFLNETKIVLGMSVRVIQVRPSRDPRWQKQGGWEVFEAEGGCPVYCDDHARESALSYAQQRAVYVINHSILHTGVAVQVGDVNHETG